MKLTDNDTVWNSPDTEQQKAAEMTLRTKAVNVEAAKMKTSEKKMIISRTAVKKKIVKRK